MTTIIAILAACCGFLAGVVCACILAAAKAKPIRCNTCQAEFRNMYDAEYHDCAAAKGGGERARLEAEVEDAMGRNWNALAVADHYRLGGVRAEDAIVEMVDELKGDAQ